jgi:hypothetical protein
MPSGTRCELTSVSTEANRIVPSGDGFIECADGVLEQETCIPVRRGPSVIIPPRVLVCMENPYRDSR